jgi:DNA-binding NarL/FixJ family response regulator
MTAIAEVVDFEALTPEQRRICQLLSQGYQQQQIARALGKTDSKISSAIAQLRRLFVDQALAQADELRDELVAHLEGIREGRGSIR